VTWERLEEVFEEVHALPDEARAPVLDRTCAGDVTLRAEVESMLAASDGASALAIERLVVEERATPAASDPWLGQSLGPWRLTRVVGHGGMGLVYGASRADGQYQLEVAVKLMRGGPRDPYAMERFRTERQVLASLKHPNIAGLLDGGFAPDGTPFLVMELVDGLSITRWCRSQLLSLEARLRLFRVVCDAVQHAHQALVVHRDLKPANILVSTAGDVKLLDFGIAKLLEPRAWGIEASETRADMRALTPDYAAPEQRDGGTISTATDVYALGVVLYELVAGVRPIPQGAKGDVGAREGAPTTVTPPSEAIRRSGRPRGTETAATVPGGPDAAARALDRRRLARRIRGDLDRIILTALREEPDRRYVSAGQLGEEIGRFLEGRPVLAQPDTVGYRFRKFVGRNRLAAFTSAVFVASLATFGGVSAWQARVLAEQRRVAQLERDASEQVARVLVDLFETTNPSVRPDGDQIPVGEFLRGSQARSLALLRDVPAVRARLQHVFGLIHQTRGQYGPAREAFEEALEERRRLVGPDAPEALESLQALGEVCHEGGDDQRSRALLEESLERHRRVYGEAHPRTARVLNALAPVVAARDLDKGGELLRQALQIRRATLPANHPDLAESLLSLANHHYQRREYERARDLLREALAVFPRPEDRRHPVSISILSDLASVMAQLDAYGEAEALQREAIELGRQVLGPENATTANLLNNLGTTQAIVGRHLDAESTFRAAFEMTRALFGEAHWRTRNVARNVGRGLALQQRYPEALGWLDRANVEHGSVDPTDDYGRWGIRAQRAQVLFRLGRRDEALAEASIAVAYLEGVKDVRAAWTLALARVLLGRMLAEAGRPREAEPVLTAALDYYVRDDQEYARRAEASCELGRARVLQGRKPEDVQRLKECLPIYKAWGLAEPEVVASLEKLVSRPAPSGE
jgi:serine/threonine-protein kinase